MRCKVAREMMEEDLRITPELQAHLASCMACADYARGWDLVHRGLATLRAQEPPQPSTGFAARVVRRLARASQEATGGQQFLVEVGRRVVYATLLVALMLVLALVVPSSGPVRSVGILESVLEQPQVAAQPSDQMTSEEMIGVDSPNLQNTAFTGANGGQGTK
jgi:hypothetical protein